MTEDEYQRLKNDTDAQQALFRKLVAERVAEWCVYAGEKLQGPAFP